jgi:hypothetical protein
MLAMKKIIMLLSMAGLLGVASASTQATVIANAELGTIVEDGIVQVGHHNYPLPPGEWRLIAKGSRKVLHVQNQADDAKVISAYLINIKDKQFRAGIQISATVASSNVGYWVEEPCKRNDVYFKDTLRGNYSFPECLIVNHYVALLRPTDTWMNDAAKWTETNGIVVPQTALAAVYDKYENGDFVQVRFWINPELAGQKPSKIADSWIRNDWHKDRVMKDSEKAAYLKKFVAWAKQVPPIYRNALISSKRPAGLAEFPELIK